MNNNDNNLQRQPLFKYPVNLGDFDPDRQGGYDTMNRVFLFGCEFESLIDHNTYAPATWDGDKTFVYNENWKLVSGNPQVWAEGNDKPASTGSTGSYPYNGMGRVVLKKNMVSNVNTLTQDMFYKGEAGSRVPNTDTVFVIKYDFTLGEDITVPANCILEFQGGSISGAYTITGTNTQIKAPKSVIFNNGVIISGTWKCPYITSTWFGDVTQNNRVKQLFNLSDSSIHNTIVVEEGNYGVSFLQSGDTAIDIKSNSDVIINGVITAATNSFEKYSIVGLYEVENVKVHGNGSLVGDIDTHTDVSRVSQWGNCISIYSCKNVYIEDLTICDACGDGMYICGYTESDYGDSTNASKNIHVSNIKSNHNRRWALSVVHADGVYIGKSIFSNTTGYVDPSDQSRSGGGAIDIEPNAASNWKQLAKNIYIDSCQFINNNGAGVITGKATQDYGLLGCVYNIYITNCSFNSQTLRINVSKNNYIDNCHSIGILYLSSPYNESMENAPIQNTIISNSDFNYIRLERVQLSDEDSTTKDFNLIVNNCKFNFTNDIEYSIYRNSAFVRGHMDIYDSIIDYKNDFISSNGIEDLNVVNCKLTQHNSEVETRYFGGRYIRCDINTENTIYVGSSRNAAFIDCIINHFKSNPSNATYLLHFYNAGTVELRGNHIINENGSLVNTGGTTTKLYFEGKIPESMDNIETVTHITTKVNRAEHYDS